MAQADCRPFGPGSVRRALPQVRGLSAAADRMPRCTLSASCHVVCRLRPRAWLKLTTSVALLSICSVGSTRESTGSSSYSSSDTTRTTCCNTGQHG
jgi:hypothetical protein